jgi:hypothetical protein
MGKEKVGVRGLLVVLAVAVFATFGFAGVAGATHSKQQGPNKDFVDGTEIRGVLPTPFGTFPANHHINVDTTLPSVPFPAKGFFWIRIFGGTTFGDVSISGDVPCLTVTGPNQANSLGIVEKSSNTTLIPPDSRVFMRHIDGGEPGSITANGAPPDEWTALLSGPGPSNSCPPIPFTTNPIDQGNFVVHKG